MSLFPAYGKNETLSTLTVPVDPDVTPKVRQVKNLPWLQGLKVTDTLSSIQSDHCKDSSAAHSKKEDETTSKSYKHKYRHDSRERKLHKQHHSEQKHPKKKKKHGHRSRDESHEPQSSHQGKDADYFEDRTRVKAFLKTETLHRPAVPVYECNRRKVLGKTLWNTSLKARKKCKRYYNHSYDYEDNFQADEGKETLAQKQENDITKKTQEFNVSLANEPHNIDLWIQYADYQEVVYQFERSYRGAHGKGSTAVRQLAIIDRALTTNPDNRKLVRKRVTIAEYALSPDVMSQQIEALLSKQPTSVELWRGFVRVTQGSMALCTVSGVVNLYVKATQKLHQSRRGAPASHTLPAENGIIDLLLDCGFFLRQAGLWEHVWVLVQAYLTLNLIIPKPKYFELKIEVPEDDVMAEEMKVVRSGLPLMTLWSRVEQIREDAHWLPVPENEKCGDHHRHVTGEDIAELVHPITEPILNFRLMSVCMLLLKIPVLPCHDCWLRLLGVDQVPWAVDGPEWFLPVLQTSSPVWKPPPATLVINLFPLVNGPQYLNTTLGQPLFLKSISKILLLLSEVVPEPAATAYLIWWVRFQRLMISMEQSGLCKLPSSFSKIRVKLKKILEKERYRNNISLYREYALLELDCGRSGSAQLVLVTAAEAAFPGISVAEITDTTSRAALISLYRLLCEIKLSEGDQEGAVKALLLLVTDRQNYEEISNAEALAKFAHIGTELLNDAPQGDSDGTESLLPDAAVNWFICHAWFVLLTDSPWMSFPILEEGAKIFQETGNNVTKERCRIEAFWEGYICVLQWYCFNSNSTFSILEGILIQAVELFPNNLHFLTSLAEIQDFTSTVTSTWVKLGNHFSSLELVLPQVFLILNGIFRHNKVKEANTDAHKFLDKCGPVVYCPCEKNRCLALLDRLLGSNATKRCPLLWRLKLYLQPSEDIFYRAVGECPWVRDLYVHGVLSVPGKADKLQTLLMEKELRCHVIPDELEVLRSGFEALAAVR